MGVPVIATLLLAGLAFRLIIAYVLFPGSGFESDLGSFVAWSLNMAENGPGRFYETAGFADYPPAYLYVLWLVGSVARGLESLLGIGAADAAGVLIKVPPMLADLGIGYLLYRLARRWFRERPDVESLALGAAAVYLVNPVAWYDSALWGQVDAVGALVMLVALALMVAGHSEGATAATVVAGLVKPQFGLVLLPLLAVVLLRRHLVRPGSGPRPEGVPERLRDWLVEEQGPWRLVSAAAVGMVTLLLLIAPFGLGLFDLVQRMAETAGGYPYLSVNAYDPWALIGADGRESLAAGGGWSPDEAPLLGPIPGVVIGTLLLALGFLYGLVGAARREGRGTLLLALIFLTLAFFVLPTRVHERYLFPVFAFLPLIAVVDRRWWIATIVLSAASFINLHGVLTTPLYATPNLDDFFLGPTFRSYLFVLLSVIGHVGVLGFVVWRWRLGDARLIEPQTGGLDREAPPERTGEVLRPTGTDDRAPWAAERPAWRSSLAGLWQRIDLAPLRADRSALLRDEPRGRLDRLDLLIVVLVFVAALTSRTWRLEEPYEMHFDEVYHARTATEFLQDWRYRLPHDIYEYTHPHLAKYLIAAGLVLAGNDRVIAGSDLGVPVVDAVVETRWSPDEQPGQHDGDRLYVATGSELRVYDLARRGLIVTLPVAAERLVVDEVEHRLFAAAADDSLVSFSTTALDLLPRAPTSASPATTPPSAQPLAQLPGPVRDLAVDADGTALVALLEDGRLLSLDPVTGETLGEARIDGAVALVAVESQEAIMVDPGSVEDVEALSGRLAELLAQDAGTIQRRIEAATRPLPLLTYPGTEQHDAVQEALDAGELPGVSIGQQTSVAVSGPDRISVRDSLDLSELADVTLPAAASGMALVREGDRPTLYVAAGDQLVRVSVPGNERPSSLGTVPMPGEINDVAWDPSSKLIHALGRAAEGGGSTIYVVEANANAVFADARLPFDPAALVLDTQPERPSADRQEALAFSPDGRVAAVDIGSHAFAWRLPGVIAGAFTAAFLYLLGRLLFRRRLIGALVALMALVDGMFFANARIAMNDTYVIAFIMASTTLFAALWLGHLRSRAALLVGLPLLGLLLGLALASKWVGAYAIGGFLVLFLLRSAVGRLLLLAGMVAGTAVLGVLAISASPEVAQPRQNFLFLALLVVLTVAVATGITLRPARLSLEQLRVALGSLLAGGAILVAAGALARHRLPTEGLASGRNILLAGGLLVLLAAGGYGVALLAGRRGIGPLVPEAATDGPSEQGPRWLDPGYRAGLPWLGALLCLTVLPLLVYILHYVPWAQPWHADGPRLASDWPIIGTWPPGHTGQAFSDLQRSMYDYHNNLRATHAASSPWWAWPLDLKPVWFYSEGLANDTSAYIYDSGNLVLFWLAIPGAAWTAWMAWRRRSLPLALVVVMMLSLWLPWARIDRATFQYHVFTSLPFAFLALAYLLAELWQGPSRRTWLLARVAGALALVGAPLLWLGRGALCGLAGTEIVKQGSQACGGAISTPIGVHQADLYAFLALALCAILAWFVLTARDSRRFVAVALGLAVLWFVAWYPNLAALPMPHIQANVFQVFLPTYNYDFQFAVNTDPPFPAPLLGPDTAALLVGVALLTVAVIYAASAWREALKEEPRGSPREPGA